MQAPAPFRQPLLAAVPRLRRDARGLTLNAHTADDLVQTALEPALSHGHQFDQRRDMLVWLLSIAHNAFLDQRRRDSRLALRALLEVPRRTDTVHTLRRVIRA